MTLDDANAMIPTLAKLRGEIIELREQLVIAREEIVRLHAAWNEERAHSHDQRGRIEELELGR